MSFRPSMPGSVLAVVVLTLFSALGNWQLQRASTKQQYIESYLSAGKSRSLPDPSQARPGLQLEILGRFDTQRHTLADNLVYQGRGGVHVYTPFETAGQTLLVNRGWLAMNADRSKLPEFSTPVRDVKISGRISELPGVGRRLGDALVMKKDQWPQLVTYPDLARISEALELHVYPLVLLLDADSPGGFGDRDWQPVYLSPEKHKAYAFQWFALATATLAGWVLLSLRRGKAMRGREN